MRHRPESDAIVPGPRRPALVRALAGTLVAVLVVAGCPALVLGESEADRFLASVLGAGASPPARRSDATWTVDGRSGSGDLYVPEAGARAGVVLVPGLAPAGRRDRRLVGFARALAGAGFAVLVPGMPDFRRYRFGAASVDRIADAVVHLHRSLGGPTGVAAISFAAGPALVALLREDVRSRVRFLASVGGYYDLEALIAYHATGTVPGEDARVPPPWEDGRWIIALAAARALSDRADRTALAAWARAHLLGRADEAPPAPAGLGAQGRALLALLTNDDPARVSALVDALPQRVRAALAAVDPSARDLSSLHADLVLVHGRGDPIVPWTQSVRLSEAAPRGGARLFLLDGLAHVDLRPAPGDLPVLREAVEAVLAYRR